MTFNQKRKLNRKNGKKILFIDLRDIDLKIYGPEGNGGLYQALDKFDIDLIAIARNKGFYRSEIWQDNIDDAKEQIYKLWEDYYGTNEETRAQYCDQADQHSDEGRTGGGEL